MRHKIGLLCLGLLLLAAGAVRAQMLPGFLWTLLPEDQMNEIIGEASGETAYATIIETGGYNKDRKFAEYQDTFYESRFIYEKLQEYGIPGARIVRFPGGKTWDGIKGELWEIEPERSKLASYQDLTAMLVSGSNSASVTASLVWTGQGTPAELDALNINGKIVVTEGVVSRVHQEACLTRKASGVIAISQSRPAFDPLQIPWSRIRGGRDGTPARFAFILPFREGEFLKKRLLSGEKIKVHAGVETQMVPYDIQNVTAHIPGTGPEAGEVIFSAHLFEGYTKQGANDNKSGSAAILEVARLLHTLIQEGRLPRPLRTIRFLWGPEFSGTGPWVKANAELMEKTLCNINMDMVGEWLSKNQAVMCLMRTTFGNPHYINDVMENYYRYVGEGNRERIHRVAPFPYKYPVRIVAPSGADEPFHYSIETHYGASDHEVFNDWAVRVPGVMMIAWPDQWYHTSGDRPDKSDPTQLKRVAVIGAAGAYTIASAGDVMAQKIASEISGNAARRLGHRLNVAVEILNRAVPDEFDDAYKAARIHIETAAENEMNTLETVKELSSSPGVLEKHMQVLKDNLGKIKESHLEVVTAHMKARAGVLGIPPAEITWTDLEIRASRMVPRPTDKVTAEGYRGYWKYIEEVPEDIKQRYPYSRDTIANTRELQLLIDGENSVLDIKHKLDAQYDRKSMLENIFNYLEVLKTAGLVEFSQE